MVRMSAESAIETGLCRLLLSLPSRPLKENDDAAVTGEAASRCVLLATHSHVLTIKSRRSTVMLHPS